MRVGVVAFESKIFESEVLDALALRVHHQLGQRTRLARELQLRLFEVVRIKVRVAKGVDEVSYLKIAYLRHHMGEKRIGSDVEGHTEERVSRALVQLAAEPVVGDIELEQAMAGR